MGLQKFCLLFLLLLATFQNNIPEGVDARPVPFSDQKNYVQEFASLGMMCQCCDGAGGECRSKWESTCSKLKCRPWKFL